MTSSDKPYDPGLQVERTLLAWRRTALAVAVVSAVGVRFTAPSLGWLALALGAVGVLLAMVVYAAIGVRYRRVHRSLSPSDGLEASGRPHLVLALAVAILGLAALGYVAYRA